MRISIQHPESQRIMKFKGLSRMEERILLLLEKHKDDHPKGLYGHQFCDLDESISRGTIHITLKRMQDRGWVKSIKEPNGKRIYLPSKAGKREMHGCLYRAIEAVEIMFQTDLSEQAKSCLAYLKSK